MKHIYYVGMIKNQWVHTTSERLAKKHLDHVFEFKIKGNGWLRPINSIAITKYLRSVKNDKRNGQNQIHQ